MRSFVAWHGEVPPTAHPIELSEAMEHTATWVRRNVGLGVVHSDVIGFEVGSSWWTLFFERTVDHDPRSGAEIWKIESYSNNSSSWWKTFYYWPDHDRWLPVRITDELDFGDGVLEPT